MNGSFSNFVCQLFIAANLPAYFRNSPLHSQRATSCSEVLIVSHMLGNIDLTNKLFILLVLVQATYITEPVCGVI